MSKGSFTIGHTGQSLTIQVNQIIGFGDSSLPFIRVPVEFDFIPGNNGREDQYGYHIRMFDATITFDGFKGPTGHVVVPDSFSVHYPSDRTIYFEFPLSEKMIAKIERNRKGNAHFSMRLKVYYGTYITMELHEGNSRRERRFISDDSYVDVNIHQQIEIPQSQWVNKVLPGLGYRGFKLVEIPRTNELINEEYKQSLSELEEAEKFFKLGEYDKTVAHCRTALDPLYEAIKVLKPLLEGKKEKEWMEDVTLQSYKWFDTLVKRTWRLAARTHHIPSIDHFDREEAEIIYLFTVALVAYFGKIKLPEKQS